jgi:hypothetical protein
MYSEPLIQAIQIIVKITAYSRIPRPDTSPARPRPAWLITATKTRS